MVYREFFFLSKFEELSFQDSDLSGVVNAPSLNLVRINSNFF